MVKSIKIRVSPTANDPIKSADQTGVILKPKDTITQDFDIRDRLAELVTKGNMLNPDDKKSIYADLQKMVGDSTAQKILTHTYLFNQRPEVQRLNPEDKLKTFYGINAADPDINKIMARSKSLGYGVIPGYRSSTSNLANPIETEIAQTPNTDLQRKVMVKVAK